MNEEGEGGRGEAGQRRAARQPSPSLLVILLLVNIERIQERMEINTAVSFNLAAERDQAAASGNESLLAMASLKAPFFEETHRYERIKCVIYLQILNRIASFGRLKPAGLMETGL